MMKNREKWKRLKNKQFSWFYDLMFLWIVVLLILFLAYILINNNDIIWAISVTGITGAVVFIIIHFKIRKHKRISVKMEKFIRRNNLFRSHYIIEQGIFKERRVEKMDYYPILDYRESVQDNIFCIRIRMDGCLRSEKFRDMEQPLANMFRTICTDKVEERGYLTYCFELQQQKQVKIQSCKDIPPVGENEIAFSSDITWNWQRCPHFLLAGNTGSGKTQLTQYIISCLLSQGVRVIYCDPKNDPEMCQFSQKCGVIYASEERNIAKTVREAEEEMRKRGEEIDRIGIQDADFSPMYVIFDELIAFSKIAEKRTYEETMKKLASIVVMGRSKRVYAGMILQRPDTSFIEGAIRDNLSCRICMGQMSDTAYKMAFGTDFSDVHNNRREIGSGLIYRQGVDTKPREFIAPYIYKGALNCKE